MASETRRELSPKLRASDVAMWLSAADRQRAAAATIRTSISSGPDKSPFALL